MKQVALVSATINTINPIIESISGLKEVRFVNYLDGYLMDKVRREGAVTEESENRMRTMIENAWKDGVDGIIVTCTIFSSRIKQFQKMIPIPIIGADTAMMEKAGKEGGKIALLFTLDKTEKPSRELLEHYCNLSGKPFTIQCFLMENAWKAIQKGNPEEHNALIRKKVEELDNDFDQIILAQVSMAPAVKNLRKEHAEIRTSPVIAFETLMEQIK